MSSPSQVIVLAEDVRHQQFARRFLFRMGYKNHHIRNRDLPSGRGSGEQWVREHYAEEVAACRQRNTRAKTALLIVIDADTRDVQNRMTALSTALNAAGHAPRENDEPIAHFIPKRNIETWILCLAAGGVDEAHDYKARAITSIEIRSAAEQLFLLRGGTNVGETPLIPSLEVARREARRIPTL
ncbi:hypothetical protein [Paludibaculum fermentans]|uniref:hypothetical protein n=1 Tax=Paludibaculum fermentans TaxID=1473598 RepID=UPI003EC12E70